MMNIKRAFGGLIMVISVVVPGPALAQFTDISASLVGVDNSAVAWGNYDNDGLLDILLAGYSISNGRVCRVYSNGGGTFTDIAAGLVGFSRGSVAWGDYDNDGDLDILLAGFSDSSGVVSRVYRNDGAGTFTDITAGLEAVENRHQICHYVQGYGTGSQRHEHRR